MWDKPQSGDGLGCILSIIAGVPLTYLLLFGAYQIWMAFWELSAVWKFWFLVALIFAIAFVIFQMVMAARHEEEEYNGEDL